MIKPTAENMLMMEPKVFGKKLDGQEYKKRRAVYGLLLNDKNQLGVVKTPRGFFLPGGGIEKMENHIQCLQREFIEETGFSVEVTDFVGCGILFDFAPTLKKYLEMIGFFYKVSLNEIKLNKLEDDHEFIWLDVVEAEKAMLLEHQAWAISQIRKM